MLVVAIVISVLVPLLLLVRYVASTRTKWYRIYLRVHTKIFYNVFIRYILQSTLKIQVASVLTLMILDDFEST